MNKSIKLILLSVGVLLLAYGVYTLAVPKTLVSIGPLEIQEKNNNNAYIAIGLGLAALLLGIVGNKKLL